MTRRGVRPSPCSGLSATRRDRRLVRSFVFDVAMSLEGGRRRAIGIDLQHRARTAVLANEYLADPGAVPQALAGLAVLRNARADFRLRRWVSQFSGDQGA